jgi:hypothetical protein
MDSSRLIWANVSSVLAGEKQSRIRSALAVDVTLLLTVEADSISAESSFKRIMVQHPLQSILKKMPAIGPNKIQMQRHLHLLSYIILTSIDVFVKWKVKKRTNIPKIIKLY